MALYIPTHLLLKLNTHAESDYPHECCGGLLGSTEGDEKTVTQVVPIQNNWEDVGDETKTRRFRISAEDYQALEAQAKTECVQLLGFYHSHPDDAPVPSDTDLSFAWPVFSYPIVQVLKGMVGRMVSYVLDLDTGAFVEEPWEEVNSA